MPQINGAKPYIMYFMLELRLQFPGKETDIDQKGVPNWGIGVPGYWDIVTVKIYILSWGLRRCSIAHYDSCLEKICCGGSLASAACVKGEYLAK